jgi:hypothetical protein
LIKGWKMILVSAAAFNLDTLISRCVYVKLFQTRAAVQHNVIVVDCCSNLK